MVEVDPHAAAVVVSLDAELVGSGYLGGEVGLEERHVVVVAGYTVPEVLPVVVAVEVVAAVARTGTQ